ncbi:hypothetical protein ACPOL_3165 [Acidisarcina polymorpha]|uniref:Uncharacterized protein n=1 Tax=Acidisarcina polymorpha TaxID=2211140 RepID=A0A2Z5G0D3_9BACT|nr:hypothetical protein ACPOL_3165 [Acidisarcina polymorpha]
MQRRGRQTAALWIIGMTEISRIKGIHLGGFELHSKNAIAAAPDQT